MKREVLGIGEEITDYKFKGILDWLITINDPREIWKAQPTYLISEFAYLTVGFLTFLHSRRVGGRFKWLWLTCIMHGFFVENMTFWNDEINNFWHSQTTIVLMGRRLPLHILFLYPTFIYSASAMVSRMRLSLLQQALATGLSVVLIDIPYDIMAVKFVHWTWHDTDPNIYDRHYWVPWTSYYFHATFACSFTLAFNLWRRLICENDPENPWVEDKRASREFLCCLLTAVCGMPGGVLQFLPIYHLFHDYLGIHTENCVITLVLVYFLIAWRMDRNPKEGSRPANSQRKYYINEIIIGLILHYSVYMGMALFGDPEYEISVGVHEKIGPCNELQEQKTMMTLITGETAKRRKYLCLEDYDEQYFDFRCVNKVPKTGSEWYTICGTPYPNKAEYVQVIGLICFVAFMFFGAMLFSSGEEWNTAPGKGTKVSSARKYSPKKSKSKPKQN
jgi:hypothetical protein